MVREFQSGDLERISEIWLEANVSAHGFIPGRYWEGQLEAVRALLPQAEVFVFQDEAGVILGFIGLNGGHIEGIFVRGAARSRGLGRQLLNRAKAAHGRLTLDVYQKNGRAIAFYRREGFRVEGAGTDGNTGEPEYRMLWERRSAEADGRRGEAVC